MDSVLGLASTYGNVRPHNRELGLSTPMTQVEALWGMEATKNTLTDSA